MGLSVSVETKKKFAELLFFQKQLFPHIKLNYHIFAFLWALFHLFTSMYMRGGFFYHKRICCLWFSKRSFLGTTMSSTLEKYCLPISLHSDNWVQKKSKTSTIFNLECHFKSILGRKKIPVQRHMSILHDRLETK